jgi:hypothetical protein
MPLQSSLSVTELLTFHSKQKRIRGNLKSSIYVLVGDYFLLTDFLPCVVVFLNICYKRCHGNSVKGFSALLGKVYDSVFAILDFPVILEG